MNRMRTEKGFKICPLCKEKKCNIDNIATKFSSILNSIYKIRNDKIVKIVGYALAKRYNLMDNKEIGQFKLTEIYENKKGKLLFEFTFTERLYHTNRPDIVLIKKEEQTIYLTEIGVSNSKV